MSNETLRDPMNLMIGMMIDTSMETTHKLIEVVNKYRASNIDVIPISEIEACLEAGHKKATSPDGLLKKMIDEI